MYHEGRNGFKAQGWYRRRPHTTVHLLADNFLTKWSPREKRCQVHIHLYPTITRWTQAIRNQEISLYLPITVVAIQCLRHMECLEPLKNRIASLCRAIRSANPGGRIFIATNIANPKAAPVLGKRTQEHNKLVCEAVIKANQEIGAVFLCDVAAHFCSNGKFLEPVSEYFSSDGTLTEVGCFVYRASLFREIGITPYHVFDN